MRRTLRQVLGPALSAVTLLSTAPTTRAADAPTSPWRDPAVIAKRLAEACDAVEAEVGVKFEQRPTARVATDGEITDALMKAEEVLALPERSEREAVALLSKFLF